MISDKLRSLTQKSEPSQVDILEILEDVPLANLSEVLSLFGDLIYAGFLEAARKLLDSVAVGKDSFAYYLMTGVMLAYEEKVDQAEHAFLEANRLEPGELAVHVNLSQMLAKQGRKEEALAWIDTGLELDANHFQLWEQLFRVDPQSVQHKADSLKSWVGTHLYVSAFHSGRAEILTELFSQISAFYLKDDDFLIEYSAALGHIQSFDKIVNLAWRVEHAGHTLHWKFCQHVAQALFELNSLESGMKYLKRALRHSEIPTSVAQAYREEMRRYDESRKHPRETEAEAQ